MPDAAAGPERWMTLGRLFPRDIRERVFEPAFGDLLHQWLKAPAAGRRVPFGVRVVAMCGATVVAAFPDFFVRRRRLTRVGRAALVIMVLLAAVVVLVFLWFPRPVSY
ncbi:MAG TPA: hypothetical protein VD793_07510 [Gemmatimonadales bacterium]|nr:hypothetical protein [Gemmatimonadales bacterium]